MVDINEVQGQGQMISVSLYHKRFTTKPSSDTDIRRISREVGHGAQKCSVEYLAQAVTQPNGQTWAPAIFEDGKRRNDSWSGQQIFAVEFDGGFSFTEFRDRCRYYRITPAFVYSTFSSEDNNRYRAIFVAPQLVDDIRVRQVIQFSLIKLFPECDSKCNDPAHFFYGGKEIIDQNYHAKLDILLLIEAACFHIRSSDPSNASRNIRRFCESFGLHMINGLPHVVPIPSGSEEATRGGMTTDNLDSAYQRLPQRETVGGKDEFLPSSICDYRGGAEIFQNDSQILSDCELVHTNLGVAFAFTRIIARSNGKVKYEAINEIKTERQRVGNIDWEALEQRSPLFKGFMSGELWLHHKDLFGLATNLLVMEGGEAKFFEGLSKRPANYDIKKWTYYADYINRRMYHPTRFENFYPEEAVITQAKNLVEAAKLPAGKINIYKEPEMKEFVTARRELWEYFQRVMDSREDKVYVIKAPTGIGKTFLYTEPHLYGHENSNIIAVQTHALKDEIHQRMQQKDIDVICSPELPKNLDKKTRMVVNKYYAIGAPNRAREFLKQKRHEDHAISEYLDDLDKVTQALNSGRTVITTHERLLSLKTDANALIIDEDILPTLLKQGSMKIHEFSSMCQRALGGGLGSVLTKNIAAADIQRIQELNTIVTRAEEKKCYTVPQYTVKEREIVEGLGIKSKASTNVIGFLSATNFIKEKDTVYYITRRNLPRKKTIILSATANETIYKRIFGDRLEFIDLGYVEMKGKIVQYPEHSYSRYRMSEKPDLIRLAQGIAGNRPIITYKGMREEFKNVLATFGALAGLDKFAGEDMVVIGTPHLHPNNYILMAHALGEDVSEEECKMEYTKVQRNGYEYKFFTYSQNPFLREIQLHCIESELIQAVGRARLLHNNCTVTVLSNLPVPGARFEYLTPNDYDLYLSDGDQVDITNIHSDSYDEDDNLLDGMVTMTTDEDIYALA